ncbi:MAG: hypothetical protein ABMB14_18220, partial [Myxococcota bacterium]
MLVIIGLGSIAHATPAYTPPDRELIWPDGVHDVPRDTAIFLLERVEDLALPQVTGPSGALDLPSRVLQGIDGLWWRVLVPTAPFEPGAYVIEVEGVDVGFTVVDEDAAVAEPPGKFRRWTSASCGDGSSGGLSYRVCEGGVIHLAVTGDDEPPAPTLDDPGEARVVGAGEQPLDLTRLFGVRIGFTETVWLGD